MVARSGGIARLPGPTSKVLLDCQGAQVLMAEDSLNYRQQHHELIASGGRITGLPGPEGEIVPGY
jgi:hypothetical protein